MNGPVFRRHSFRISTILPDILTRVLRDFPYRLQTNATSSSYMALQPHVGPWPPLYEVP
jgi:hypothetical protein